MTWAPPLPPPAPADADRSTECAAESERDRRRLSAVPAAAWVAVVGGALVLVAAAILVVSNWDAIGRSMRLAGLALATAALLAVSERLRPTVPTSAQIMAHVGTFLTAAVGIAGTSLLGFTWPTCLLVGGAAAAIATGVQARRWSRSGFHLGQVAGLTMAAVGLGEISGTTGGVVAALAALALLVHGSPLRAAALSMLAVLSPALTALADAGVGAGTLARAGLVGERLSWSGPTVGVLAAMVLATVARQRASNPLLLCAIAAPIIGGVTGLAAIEGPGYAWWCLPAIIVIGAELASRLLPSRAGEGPIRALADVLAASLGVLTCLAPLYLLIASWTDQARSAAVPLAVTALAVALSTLRWRTADRLLGELGLAATASAAVAVTVALGWPAVIVAGVSIGLLALSAFLSRRLHPVAVYVPAGWALAFVVAARGTGETSSVVAALGLLAVLTSIVVATRVRLSATTHWMGWVERSVVVLAVMAAAVDIVDGAQTVALVAAAIVTAAVMAVERRTIWWGTSVLAVVGLATLDAAARTGAVAAHYWTGWAAVAGAFALTWVIHRTRWASYPAAAAVVATLAAAAAPPKLIDEQFLGLAMTAAVVLTGLTITVGRRTELDAAAAAAGCVALLATGLDVDAAWVSATVALIGLQAAAFGVLWERWSVTLTGGVTAITGAASWWFTTGLHERFMSWIEPADITVADLWLGLATASAFAAGAVARRATGASSWYTHSTGLVVAGLWLVPVQVERDTVWAVPLALAIAIAAMSAGAWHRLAAPLVGGTALAAITLFVATGSDLDAIPAWAWLAIGGTVLLAVGTSIERTGARGSTLSDLVKRWR